MDRKIPLVGSFATDWIRYSDYEWKETVSGETYIVPKQDAVFTMYNPFDVAEDLLVDLLTIGEEAFREEDNQAGRVKNALLIFAKKYGLLGLVGASVYNRNIIGEDTVLLIEKNLITKEKMMDAKSYIQKFIPFAEEGDVVFYQDKRSSYVRKAEDAPYFYGKRPLILDLVFSRFYAEQTDWIIAFSKMLVTHLDQLLIYRNTSGYLHENVTILAGQFHAQKIGFTINYFEKATIAWEFDSLKTAIEAIYGFAVTDENIALNRCSNCQKIFISKSDREKYCSPACRNRANVKKSRSRKLKQMEE